MQQWDLEAYDMWPQTVTDYQHDSFFEVLHGYSTGQTVDSGSARLYLFSGIRERREGESRYLCAQDDLLNRPRSRDCDYPWDVTFHGHKGTDDPELGAQGAIINPVSVLGGTRLVVPFKISGTTSRPTICPTIGNGTMRRMKRPARTNTRPAFGVSIP